MFNYGFFAKGMTIAATFATVASGCTKLASDGNSVRQTAVVGSASSGPQFGICFSSADPSGNPAASALYCDNSSGSSLRLVEGKQYVLAITPISSGTYQYQFSLQRVDVISGSAPPPQTFPAGNSLFTAPAPGDYAIRVAATDGSTVFPARSLQATVNCDAPMALNAAALNRSAISAAPGSSTNFYNFSASGITDGQPGGIGPYLCAWDFNGDGTRDSVFRDCSDTLSNVYVNYLGTRNVGVIVKDSCNTAVSVSNAVNLPLGALADFVPGDQNVWIHAQTSNASGTAAGSAATQNVDYWATNGRGIAPVQPHFTYAGANSSFVIESSFTYGMPGSLNFGVKLAVSNISASLTGDGETSTIDASGAKLTRLDYTTDQAGDTQPSLSLSGSACSLTKPGAEIIQVQGQPCAPGTDNAFHRETTYTIHVWGSYSCDPVVGSGGSMKAVGEFNGLSFLTDSCVGGGGGGGGGIVPIKL